MKKYVLPLLIIAAVALFVLPLVSKRGEEKLSNEICFGTSADYPPFEYFVDGKFVGFEIELAEVIAQKLGKKAVFKDMSFASILPALKNGVIDAAIASLEANETRRLEFDFSDPYLRDEIFAVFRDTNSIGDKKDLKDKKITCQLGSSMHVWVESIKNDIHLKGIDAVDNMGLAIETLKQGLTDVVVINESQAKSFCAKNSSLRCVRLDQSSGGAAIAFKKGSTLQGSINKVLQQLISDGSVEKLIGKWIVVQN